jgi:hypothetical protein
MGTSGPIEVNKPEPVYSPTERGELAGLAFLLAEVERFRQRGLIPEASHATIVAETQARREAIERRGQYQATLTAARRMSPQAPAAAVVWAERARLSDPSEADGWALEFELRRRLKQDERALALVTEADVSHAETVCRRG